MKNSLPLYNTYRMRLSKTALFQGLSMQTLDDMLSHFRFESWNRGSTHDSSIALRRFYVILEGRMQLTRIHPGTGKQITISILSDGDMYDVLTLLDGQQHAITPSALDDLKLLSAPIDEVRDWIREHPDFNNNFLPYLGRRIRCREALATDLGLYDTHTRLARLILRHVNPHHSRQTDSGIDVQLLHDLSNETIGQMVGAARQVINKHLQAMKKDGILHIEKRHLIIDDLNRLQQEAEDLENQFL
ncbi:Crp/Fnr family transcriptional regulator [Thiolapillus brandeum]|uniref:Transcriptional regulator, Crp/Fnr family n=1 Tax=Thiolapillus brandeum TaxID=1076588 RepID=A0A7U6JHP3_9GAMM|nr:Crp/Fnr family transcriptional regulator [Thiolapillus brandeum]BAO44679.1 transcriptional regulator, Crp/Fnr family [Thiolapillus brandeum]